MEEEDLLGGEGGGGWLDFKITRRRHNSVGPQGACPDRAPHWEIAVVVVAWLLSGAEVVPGDGEAVRDNKRYFYFLVIKKSFFFISVTVLTIMRY